MFRNHSCFSSIQPFSFPSQEPQEPKSTCIANQIYNPAAPSTLDWLPVGWPSSGPPSGTGSSDYALRENGYWGCHQSKSRTLCTGSKMTCTPCSLRSFRPPRTGESWNTSLTRWCRMSVLTLIVNWEGKANSAPKINNLVIVQFTVKWDSLDNIYTNTNAFAKIQTIKGGFISS